MLPINPVWIQRCSWTAVSVITDSINSSKISSAADIFFFASVTYCRVLGPWTVVPFGSRMTTNTNSMRKIWLLHDANLRYYDCTTLKQNRIARTYGRVRIFIRSLFTYVLILLLCKFVQLTTSVKLFFKHTDEQPAGSKISW